MKPEKNRTCNSNNPAHDCNNTADTSPKGLAERLLERVATPQGYYITLENRNGKSHKNSSTNHYIGSVSYYSLEVVGVIINVMMATAEAVAIWG